MPATLLRYVRARFGESAVADVIERAGVPYSADHLDDIANWIWYDEAVALFAAAAELTGDPHIGTRVGEETVRQHAGTPVATLFRSLGSPQAVFEQLALAATKFSTVTEFEPLEVAPGRAVVRAKARPGYRRHPQLCDFSTGMLSQPTVLFGLPPAEVVEECCELRGDDHCLYRVSWDAEGAERAADPHQLVTALEAQLGAMHERLESMYATAKDLIELEDLDAALARITDRAATAVRAPNYLLAVRPRPGEPLRVHHRGFGEEDPEMAAEALLAAEDPNRVSSQLVAEIRSATRYYGRLMAAAPSGAFFPHERDLLSVYASYAATVLDTATALDEARRESGRSQALLELSSSLAAAGTRDEVAEKLAVAVPTVVDCDAANIFLWDDDEDALTCRAATGFTRDVVAGMAVRRSDSPDLARQLDSPDPTPVRFDHESTDAFARSTVTGLGMAALVVAPIVAHGHFYGSLNVGVSERPERLALSPDLLDGLAGVVAQAATALDNARLMETMDHQARHDNLTGLLGHRAFHERLGTLLTGEDRVFTLATIDIDDFKAINDSFGHPVGDEALVLVAGALRSAVRSEDTVFRVGGEEFGVLLPGLCAADALPVAERLRETVAAVDFQVPLRVSVGLAAWPDDAADRRLLIERADAALYEAKRSGKDCTRLVAAA